MSLQQVVIRSDDNSGHPDPDHDQKMIALVDGKQADPARPEWLPEKFKTVEEMAASYKELESKLGGAKPPVPAATPAPPADAPKDAPADALKITAPEADAAVAKAGLDMAALNAEFADKGTLSEASYAKLAAVGFDKAAVDNYVAGQQALMQQFQSEVLAVTPGGADKYSEMVEWAKVNLSASEVDAYNAAVSSGNKDQAKLAVAGLGARFTASVGNEPNLQGGRVNADAGDVFTSIAQMKSAMSDPRYKDDPAYRNAVREKLGRSNIL